MTKRKVLIYRNELLPPSETFILTQANALKRFQPVFAGLKRVSNSLDVAKHSIVVASQSDSWKEKLKRRIFLRTGLGNQFLSSIEAEKPELVHAHFAIDACAALPIIRRLRIPLIVTLHGYDITRHERALHRWPTTRAYLRRKEELWEEASLFLCVSAHVRDHALLRGFPEKKLLVHHVGVDLRVFSPLNKPSHEKIVLFVGRLVEKKGCAHLIRAMLQVEDVISEARLVIVGDGPLRMTLQKEAADLKNCAFLGQQSHSQIREWMGRASLLVAPSICASDGDSEGLPTVVCEAQAIGLPVVAFATDGVLEAFPVERSATLPQEGDELGLAKEMISVLKDDNVWQQLSLMGRRSMEERFDLERQTCILEHLYDEVSEGHNG